MALLLLDIMVLLYTHITANDRTSPANCECLPSYSCYAAQATQQTQQAATNKLHCILSETYSSNLNELVH